MSSVDVQTVVAGRYRLTSLLHRGQGVETFVARDLTTDHPAVVKVAGGDGLSDQARRRLEHESNVLARMDHPNLVPLLDQGRDGDLTFLVTPWVPGRSLAARLVDGPLTVPEVVLIGRDVVRALSHAHDHGILHRDVKPGNVMLTGDPLDQAVLIDFGLARSELLDADVRDVPVGSVRYLAPEQAGLVAGAVDERSDLFAVGVTLLECLTGSPVFAGDTVGDVLRAQMTVGPPPLDPSVPRVLGHILGRAMRRDPSERYQSAHALLHDLDQLAQALADGVVDPSFVVGTRDRRETLAEPTFIGRVAELRQLDDALGEARAGRGGVVLLGASSGGGKSRLLEEFDRRAGDRVRRFHGQGLDQAAQRPFQVLSGVVRDLLRDDGLVDEVRERLGTEAEEVGVAFPELASQLGVTGRDPLGPEEFGEVRTLRGLSALLDALGSARRAAVVVLDDCQWADDLSALLLQHWNRSRARPCHVLVVVAYRSDELPTESAIRRLDPLARVGLRPLAEEDIGALATSMAGALPPDALDVVVRLSEGSPFMAAAVLRGLVESEALVSGPEGWEVDPEALADARSSRRAATVLAHRIQLLSDGTRRLLGVGAVLGKEFEVDVAAALAAVQPIDVGRAVREASRRHLVWPSDGSRCRFVHDKIREALLEQLEEPVRRDLHVRTAELLELREPTRFFDLAFHFDAGGDPARALPYALAAAEQARAQQSLEAVEQQLRIAERGASDAGDEVRSRVAEDLGRVLMLRGRYGEAGHHLERARTSSTDRLALARIDGTLGELAFKRGDMKTSSEALERAVRTLGQRMPRRGWWLFTLWEVLVQLAHSALPPRVTARRSLDEAGAEVDLVAARLYSRLAHTYWFQRGSVATAFVHLRGMNLAERYPPTPELAQAYSEHAPVMVLVPWYRRGIAYATRSLRIREELGDVYGQGQSMHFHGIVLYAASRWEDCLERCRAAVRLLDRTGDRWEANTARWHIGYASYRLGDLDAAARIGEDVWRSGVELGDPQARGIALAVWSKATGGRVPAEVLRPEVEQLSEDVHTAAEVLSAEAVRLLGAARPSEAVVHLRRADRMVRDAGFRQEYVAPVPAWLLTALRAEREAGAGTVDLRRRRRELRAARRVGRRARRLGRWYANNLPHALREAALVEAELGRRRRARRWLDRSVAVAEGLGARQELALSRAARGELGARHGWPGTEADLAASESAHTPQPGAEAVAPITLSLADRFESLLSSGRRIASSLTAEGALAALADAAESLLRPQDCLVLATTELERSPDSAALIAVAGTGAAPSRTIVERVLAEGQPVVVQELLDSDASDSMVLTGVRSVLSAPIHIRGEPVGCLYVSHRDLGGAFGEDEIRISGFLTALTGAALENAESFAEVEALTRTLEQRVVDRTSELVEANTRLDEHVSELEDAYEREQGIIERLRRLDRFKTELVAITAHDLRTPLTIIFGFANTLHEHADRLGEDQRRALLQRIMTNSRRLSEFVENLLQFARIESDELQIEPTSMDLVTLVRRTVDEFAETEPDRTIEVVVEADLPPVRADESRQWQVLVNLLSNAVKYSPPGTPVRVEVRPAAGMIEVAVTDRGEGIPAAELPKLFGKFIRVDSGGERKAMGTGLGLYICRSLVEAHGGRITVESTVGQGTTFRYTVPVDRADADGERG